MNFNDIFKSNFIENVTSVSILDMAAALLLAFGLGMFIFLVYKKTYSGVMYSASFGTTLVALTMITTVVILAVTSNVVLSLGMVGALSIVRFRTAIKEPLDIAFLFWSIAVGIVLAAGMIHNYYLYEENGKLSMIPWDYNLAFGNFQSSNASSSVNSPIDTPVSGDMSDRPMIAWIFDNEEYTEQYHRLFRQFLESIDLEKLVSDTAALIDRYVEKGPTKFCTYEEFKKGVEALRKFSTLRVKSVRGQLDGTIPSTDEGQKTDSSALVDTDGLNISDMGSMGGFGGGIGGNKGGFGRNNRAGKSDVSGSTEWKGIRQADSVSAFSAKMLNNFTMLADEDDSNQGKPQRGNGGMPDFGGQPPQDFDPGNIPDGFDPGNMPEGFSPFGNTENPSADDTEEEKASESEEAVSSDNGSGAAQGKMPGGELPDMNRFTNMNGAEQRDNTTAYILLGTSALVLLLGLGFALKFKR